LRLKNNIPPTKELLTQGDFADVYLEESRSLGLHWEDGQVQSIIDIEDAGVGLRFLKGEETRYAFIDTSHPLTRGICPDAQKKLFQLKSQLNPGFPVLTAKPIGTIAERSHPLQKDPMSHPLNEKISLLHQANDIAQKGPFVRQITMNYGEKQKKVGYLNSEGESFVEERTYLVFNITVTVEREGDIQTAYESMGGVLGFELFDKNTVQSLAALVRDRALKKLEAPKAPVGEMPVVIASSAGGTLIHEAVGHSLEADAVLEGTSPAYIGKIGKQVGNEKLTVLDDPTVPMARGSFYFDDEGVPSERSVLIENGVLKNYMFDRKSARKAGRMSNGHGRRESFAHRPLPRMSNTFVAPGPDDPQQILEAFRNGFLVTKMGGGQVNTANGDFVFEVEEGFHINNGKKTLVRGATLLGNGPNVLMQIDQVGSDHGWAIGTCGKEGQGVPVSDALPTVHIKKLVVGGQ